MDIVADVVGTSIKIYALMTPPAVLSAFISGTRTFDRRQKAAVAAKTSTAIFCIGVTLFLFGPHLFALFGFTLDAFRIGAGVLLFLTAVSLMNDDGKEVTAGKDGDISVVPLAIPLGMGPASIGAVMVMGASAKGLEQTLVGVLSLLLAALGMFVLLRMADTVVRRPAPHGHCRAFQTYGPAAGGHCRPGNFTGIRAFLG